MATGRWPVLLWMTPHPCPHGQQCLDSVWTTKEEEGRGEGRNDDGRLEEFRIGECPGELKRGR